MVSTLKVQTIQIPNSDSDIITFDTSGNVTLNANKTSSGFGVSTASSTLPSEGGAATTNVVQGLAKGWLHYDQRTPTVRDSFNITSVEDTAAGHYKATITNAMDNIYYTLAHSGSYDANITNSSRADIHFGFPETTTLYQNGSMNTGNSYIDDTYSLSVVHGDLA